MFGLGRRDEYGRQVRVEHRGRTLRASRTGGVALRAQAKAAGITLTANTAGGVRVSATPVRNTQLALQNGRFVLRGRYDLGPVNLNVSKRGASLASRNALGSFNWTHPNRSSAKVAGIQLRGRKAAQLQFVYLLVTALFSLAWFMGALLYGLFQVLAAVFRLLGRRAPPPFEQHFAEQDERLAPPIPAWEREWLLAGLLLCLAGLGRGREAGESVQALERGLARAPLYSTIGAELGAVAARLDRAREAAPATDALSALSLVARLGGQLAKVLEPAELPEAFFQADELALEEGPRTRLQEALFEVLADSAGLHAERSGDSSRGAGAHTPQD